MTVNSNQRPEQDDVHDEVKKQNSLMKGLE